MSEDNMQTAVEAAPDYSAFDVEASIPIGQPCGPPSLPLASCLHCLPLAICLECVCIRRWIKTQSCGQILTLRNTFRRLRRVRILGQTRLPRRVGRAQRRPSCACRPPSACRGGRDGHAPCVPRLCRCRAGVRGQLQRPRPGAPAALHCLSVPAARSTAERALAGARPVQRGAARTGVRGSGIVGKWGCISCL